MNKIFLKIKTPLRVLVLTIILLVTSVFCQVGAITVLNEPTVKVITAFGGEFVEATNESLSFDEIANSRVDDLTDISIVDKEYYDFLSKSNKRELRQAIRREYENKKMITFIGNQDTLDQNEIYNTLEISNGIVSTPVDKEAEEMEKYLTSISVQEKDGTMHISRSYYVPKDGEKVSKEKVLNSVTNFAKKDVIVERTSALTVNAASTSLVNNYDYKENFDLAGQTKLIIAKTIDYINKGEYTIWGVESADRYEQADFYVDYLVQYLSVRGYNKEELLDVRPNNSIGEGQNYNISLSKGGLSIGGSYKSGAGKITDQSNLTRNYAQWKYKMSIIDHPDKYTSRSTAMFRNDSGPFYLYFRDSAGIMGNTIPVFSNPETSEVSVGMKVLKFNDLGQNVK